MDKHYTFLYNNLICKQKRRGGLDTIERIFAILLFAILGGVSGPLAIYAFNRIPAKWLCDYDEDPSMEMWGVRIKNQPWVWVFAVMFSAAAIKLLDHSVLYALPGLAALWLLLQIGIADKMYIIIPDQHVVALGVAALGFVPFHSSFWSPLLGALMGGGSFLFIGLLGQLIYKREVLGFGDIKLLSVLGLLCGLKGMLFVLFATIAVSGLVFGIGLFMGKIKGTDEQPLGPFICAAAAVYILFRKEILDLIYFYSGS